MKRLHQEDFAQILGVPAAAKYSVTWKESFDLLSRHATAPAAARVELLDRLLFNLILGNSDAHAKNFALLHEADGVVRLAPAYDLLSTRVYPSLSPAFAMRIGNATTLDALGIDDWRSFTKEVGDTLPFVRQRGSELSEQVTKALPDLPATLAADHPGLTRDIYPARRRDALFQKVRRVVVANVKRVGRSLSGSAP